MKTNNREIDAQVQQGESLALEFKSDRKGLSDRDLVAAVVSLANTEGGELLLGVEDDGTVTGLHESHKNISSLPALIANRTNPALSVRVQKLAVGSRDIARIEVPKSRQIVATSDGASYRRRIKFDGTPEAVPFYPHEFIQRQSSMGLVDPSAMVLEAIDVNQLDPLQRLRIRNAIKKYGGEQPLLALSDDELDGALGLVKSISGKQRPTVAGLLLLGTEDLLRTHLPAYEVAFQVLSGTDVKVNEFYRKPLIETFEEVELQFKPWVVEEELEVGLFRVPIPNSESQTRIILEKLLESGLIEAHSSGRGRSYTLSAEVYRRSGQKAAYVRQVGFEPIQQEQMVLKFIQAHGQIKRADVMDLCHLNGPQAYRLLKKLTDNALIIKTGERKHAVYTRKR